MVELAGKQHWWWDTRTTNDGGALDDGQRTRLSPTRGSCHMVNKTSITLSFAFILSRVLMSQLPPLCSAGSCERSGSAPSRRRSRQRPGRSKCGLRNFRPSRNPGTGHFGGSRWPPFCTRVYAWHKVHLKYTWFTQAPAPEHTVRFVCATLGASATVSTLTVKLQIPCFSLILAR